ncbi:hypothetical protein INR49_019847 [Caranx melampygus]|nr:hypothetical protein INR49_019847 [Caranx melampygus]
MGVNVGERGFVYERGFNVPTLLDETSFLFVQTIHYVVAAGRATPLAGPGGARQPKHPYPSEEQKKQLAQDTGLTILQVNNW